MEGLKTLNGLHCEQIKSAILSKIEDLKSFVETHINCGEVEPLLLDLYPDAIAAFSLRKLRNDYTGYCIRVYDSPNYYDIGFTSDGVLDEADLLSKTTPGYPIFVETWYDQSGNGNDAVREYYPAIKDETAIYKQNSKPSILFTYSSLSLSSKPLTGATQSSFFGVANFGSASDYEMLFTHTDGTANYNRYEIRRNGTTNNLDAFAGSLNSAGTRTGGIVANTLQLIGFIRTSSTEDVYINDNIVNSINSDDSSKTISDANCYIGFRTGGYGPLGGYVSEIILYASDKTSDVDGIKENINNFYSLY